jgi:Cys-tRNA(Pro)/Cys-tRNA(Cys) deacylase
MTSLGEKSLLSTPYPFTSHEYDYRQKGVEAAAEALDLDPTQILKTLVVELARKEEGRAFVFLMVPGKHSASMKQLARALGAKQANLASERDAERLTGYQVGGIGPFGARTPLPVFIALAACDHNTLYFNGGRRGLMLSMTIDDLLAATKAELLDVTQP